jgi:hypothetical protein
MEWTSRSRIEATFSHREPDRTPLFEYILLGDIAEDILGHSFHDYSVDVDDWLARTGDTGFEALLQGYAQDRITMAMVLGHDMLYVCPNPIPGSPYVYDPLVGLEKQFDQKTTSDPVENIRRRNDWVRSELIKPPPSDSYLVFEFLFKEMEKMGIDLPVFAPAYFHGIWNDIDLMQTLLLDPEAAHEHFSLATLRACSIIDDYHKVGVEMIGIGGDFAGQSLLISPEAYNSFIVPEVRALSDYIHSFGGLSINATDGNLWLVIDEFLLGCGVDGYMEIDYGAGMDLAKLKRQFGEKITFLGNMDCGNILSFSSVDVIKRITHEILDAGAGNGGHVFCASNAITPSIPIENYLAMINAYREHFRCPPLHLE